MAPARDARDVLPGPKKPFWGCPKCGEDQNWASRVVCRCGARASQKVCERAQAAAKKHAKEKEGSGGSGSGKASDRGRSGPSASGASKELAELKAKLKEREKEIDRLKAAPKDEEEDDDEDEKQAGPSIESLVNLHREAEKALGAEAAITKDLEQQLRIARERRDSEKPVGTRLRDLEALSRKRKGQIESAEEAAVEALEAHEEAKGKLDEAREDVAKRKRELSEVDGQIAELRAKQLLEAAVGGAESRGDGASRVAEALGQEPAGGRAFGGGASGGQAPGRAAFASARAQVPSGGGPSPSRGSPRPPQGGSKWQRQHGCRLQVRGSRG